MNIIDTNNRLMRFLKGLPYEGSRLNNLAKPWDYEFERISEFADAYDDTGELTLLYLADGCRKFIADAIVPVELVLANPGITKPYSDCKALIDSPLVKECRKGLADKLSAIIAAISGRNLIGDASSVEAELDNAVDVLFEGFRTLRFEAYMNSGRMVEWFDAFSSSVQVSNSLAEMLLRLEGSPDGVYVGYVSNPGTLDGWFGFFCKSNGNMFSYNERIDEAYVGQHGRLRNGRYAEVKAYDLFPYELCKFSDDRDYKGYSKEVTIGSNLSLFDMGNFSLFIRTILSMAVIARKHAGRTLQGEAVVIDSLLPANLARIGGHGEDEKAIVKWEGSPLVKAAATFNQPKFEEEKVLSGYYDEEFCHREKRNYKETGFFHGANQDIVDAYGDGFKIDNEKVLVSNSSRRLIGDGETSQEFVGSPARFRLRAYMEVRGQLAAYVGKRLRADLDDFGGVDELKRWYAARLAERMDKVLSFCASTYRRWSGDKEHRRVEYGEYEKQNIESNFRATTHPFSVQIGNKPFWDGVQLSERKDGMPVVCPVFHCHASWYFLFEFFSYKQVRGFLGCEMPKFCVGWTQSPPYNGNRLLDVTDPVGELIHPLYQKFNFNFSIGLSKRAINAAMRIPVSTEGK